MNVDIAELCKLPAVEKLRIVEILWDDISKSNVPIVLHDWQIEETRRRNQELDQDPSIAIDREAMWKQIDG